MTTELVLKRIREERISRGISLRVMAKKLGVSAPYLSMIERGESPLKMDDYFKICKILEIKPSKILTKREDREARESLAEKIYDLSDRDFSILKNMVEFMK